MPILLESGAEAPASKVYLLSVKDSQFVDAEFDNLQAQGKLDGTGSLHRSDILSSSSGARCGKLAKLFV